MLRVGDTFGGYVVYCECDVAGWAQGRRLPQVDVFVCYPCVSKQETIDGCFEDVGSVADLSDCFRPITDVWFDDAKFAGGVTPSFQPVCI